MAHHYKQASGSTLMTTIANLLCKYCVCLIFTLLHVFPGSLTLGEVRAALWSACTKWFYLGIKLEIPYKALEVIEKHIVPINKGSHSIS